MTIKSYTIERNNAEYPARLLEALEALEGCQPAAPDALHIRGALPEAGSKSAAIIGARFASEYGRYTARMYGRELAMRGYDIITDMALGCGGIAAKAALDAGAKVYAVFGCGADVCYPPENRDLYDGILQAGGGVISEHPFGTLPQSELFSNRRRIMAALADVIVVIEARKKSGALVTAELALKIGKKVYCVPGRVTDRLSDGCNAMIKAGAFMTMTPDDVTA